MTSCPVCRGPMKPLFTSFFCPKDCDRLGKAAPATDDGWEPPTHAALCALSGQTWFRRFYAAGVLKRTPRMPLPEAEKTWCWWSNKDPKTMGNTIPADVSSWQYSTWNTVDSDILARGDSGIYFWSPV